MGFKWVGVAVKLKSSVKIKYKNAIWKLNRHLGHSSRANGNKTNVGKVHQQNSYLLSH